LLDQLLELDEAPRQAFLDALTGEDALLKPELERLLGRSHELKSKPLPTGMDLAAPAFRDELHVQMEADEKRVGQLMGSYRLLRLLGVGGMGVVYLAEREAGEFSHQVALKLMRTAVSTSSAKERFDRERQILASLKHPGIALLFDGGHTSDGQAFYTMEYVEGMPVTEYCFTHVDSVEARIGILLQVASALAYAHQNLVVHRDIKPSNVLVDAAGQIKLVDFGLAKLLQPSLPPVMTQAGTMPMTPAYAAPEQFHSDAITVATDIYQFGVLCFVVLTERLPYRADVNDSLAWARAVTGDFPMTLQRAFALTHSDGEGNSRFRRGLVRDLDAILDKAMAKEPSSRYGSMDALIADLRAFLDGRPVAARRAATSYLMWRFIARHRYAVAATLAAFIALATTAVIAVRQSRIAAAEADRANTVASFLVGLFQVADPSVNRGERLNANQILEKGAERIDREMASQPAQRARLQSVIGEVYAILGDYARARAALDPAIVSMTAMESVTDPIDLAHALDWRAFITATEGDYKGALATLDRASALLTGDTPRQQDELATVHARRASAYSHLGDYAAAKSEYEKAIRLRDKLGQRNTLKMAGIHNNYGTMLRAINDQVRARNEFSQALEIFLAQEGNPEKSYFVMGARMNLATALIDLDDLDAGEALLRKASDFFREMTGSANVGYANAENKLGEIERLRGRYDEALGHYANAEGAYRGALGDHHYLVASPMQNRGQAELEKGDYEAALAEFERGLSLRLESLPASHREIASAMHGRAQALLGLRRYEEAKDDLTRALGIWRNAVPADHPLIVYALFNLGQACRAMDDPAGNKVAWDEALRRLPVAFADSPARLAFIRNAIENPGQQITIVRAGSYDE
jgi:serine/threonine-protein kinase